MDYITAKVYGQPGRQHSLEMDTSESFGRRIFLCSTEPRRRHAVSFEKHAVNKLTVECDRQQCNATNVVHQNSENLVLHLLQLNDIYICLRDTGNGISNHILYCARLLSTTMYCTLFLWYIEACILGFFLWHKMDVQRWMHCIVGTKHRTRANYLQ